MHSGSYMDALTLDQFLSRNEAIATIASNLRKNTRDQFALGLLVRFEELDALDPFPAVGLAELAVRDSLRRVVAELLAHHAGSPASALMSEITVLSALVSGAAGSPQPRKLGLKAVSVLVAACIGAGMSTAVLLPMLGDARGKATDATKEIAGLKVRLAEVANEKAQEQDAKEYATLIADEIAEIAVFAADITTDLELCIDYGNQAVDIALQIANGYTYDDAALARFTDDWSVACDDALVNAAALREYLAQTQRP